MTDRPRVVVTGIGAVSAWGWTSGDLQRGLRTGQSAISELTLFDSSAQRTHLAAEVPPPSDTRPDSIDGSRHLSRADRFAVAAASEAFDQADLSPSIDPVGVFFGGSTGGMWECEEYVARLLGVRTGRPRIAWLASQQINCPGDAVARHLRLTGPTLTISSACASGTLAVGAALDAIRRGEINVAIAGGSDALCVLTYSGFNALRSVDPKPCRPFRADRVGLSLGEGAGVLVLETARSAESRGAKPLAELLGWGASCDAHHMTAPHPEGDGAARAIIAALSDAELQPDEIGFVNAHGTGTPLNDISECRALHRVFGPHASGIPVTANKASVGHQLGCSGAVEAVATVLALVDHEIQPTAGRGKVDGEIDLDVVLEHPRSIPPGSIGVSVSFAFGGACAAVIVADRTIGARS